MSRSLLCPACNSPNDPADLRCRLCGAQLHRIVPVPTRRGSPQQRITSDATFGTIVDSSPPEPEDAKEEEPDTPVVPAPPLLAELRDRITSRAADSGQRFKPYGGGRARTAKTEEARKLVAKQLESAARAFRERRFDAAIDHLLKAIAKEDGDPRSWILLGEAYLRLERPYKAAVGYLRALELDPDNDNAWLGLARSLRAMDDLDAALVVLDRSVASNPAITEAWSERGIVLESLNRPVDAAKSFQKALELRPDHPTARVGFERLSPMAQEMVPVPPPETTPPPASAPETPQPERAGPSSVPSTPEEDDLPDFADLAEMSRPATTPPPKEGAAPPGRVRTFVDGLDEILGGGVPKGHVVVVEGSAGTMKSSLVFSILAHAASEEGRNGLYLSLHERTSSLLSQMGSLGLPLRVDRGSLVVIDPRAAKGLLDPRKDWLDAFQAAVDGIRGKRGLDLLAIDSLESLESLAQFQDPRRELLRLFEWLRDSDITSFVISETPDPTLQGGGVPRRSDQDFLADGVLHLAQHPLSDRSVERRIRVVKMRGTRHDAGYHALVFDVGNFKVARITG